MRSIRTLILTSHLMASTAVAADVYLYKDKNGVLQFTTACVYFEKFDAKWSEPTTVKIFGVLYRIDKSLRPGALNEVVFSIQNASKRPLQCVRIAITVKNPRREIIHQQETLIDVSSTPVPAGNVRQMSQRMSIDGFEVNGQRGSVTVDVLSARYSSPSPDSN